MRALKNFSIVILWGTAHAIWSPFGPNEVQSRHTVNRYDLNFDARDLSDPKLHTSEVHMRAFTGLQKLEKKSSCHRIALRLYAANCRLFDKFGAEDNSLASETGDRLQDYIDSFSASLAICDLEAAHAAIPEACDLFRESILTSVVASKDHESLHASHEQIRMCMKGLHSNQNSWTSFNSNKDTAAILCLLPRQDIDRDNLISIVEAIIGILSDVRVSDEHRKEARAEEELVTKRHFQSVREHITEVKDGVLSMWDKISSESTQVARNLADAMMSASDNLENTNMAIKAILKSLIEGNAEHALAQQQAVVATSDLAIVTKNVVVDFRQLMVDVGFNLTAMGLALAAMEQRHTEALDQHSDQVQVLMKDVREDLHRTREVISEVKDSAEKTAQLISKWAVSMLPNGPGGISWPLFVMAPTITVVLVGYGIPASYTRNIGLAVTGVLIAKGLTMTINGQLQADAMNPQALAQLARKKLSATIFTASSIVEPHTPFVGDVGFSNELTETP